MKKFMLKMVGLFIALFTLFGSFTTQAFAQEKLNVVVTTTHLTDLLEQIGGDRVEVTGLMGAGVDPHGYTPTPSDIDTMNNADVIVHNGLHLEAMFTDVFASMEESEKDIFSLEEALTKEDIIETKNEGEDLEKDPHIWFAVDLWKKSAQLVADELKAIDPDGAEYYQANADKHIAELDELDTYIKDRVNEVAEESRYLITAHDAFNYFGNRYGFEVVGIQGLNSQTEAGTGDIVDVAKLVKDHKIASVFIESSVPDRNVQALIEAVKAEGGNLEIGGVLYSDALGTKDENAGTYIDAYRANIDTIVDGLK